MVNNLHQVLETTFVLPKKGQQFSNYFPQIFFTSFTVHSSLHLYLVLHFTSAKNPEKHTTLFVIHTRLNHNIPQKLQSELLQNIRTDFLENIKKNPYTTFPKRKSNIFTKTTILVPSILITTPILAIIPYILPTLFLPYKNDSLLHLNNSLLDKYHRTKELIVQAIISRSMVTSIAAVSRWKTRFARILAGVRQQVTLAAG